MAHPYKQKYNNFNGPGHQSPANIIPNPKKWIWKKITGGLDDIWKATKNSFVSRNFDNSINWTKTKNKIGKTTLVGGGVAGGLSAIEGERQRVVNAIVTDNIQEPKTIKIINDKFKVNKDKEINLDSIIKANK